MLNDLNISKFNNISYKRTTKLKGDIMYKFFAIISFIVRNFYLPNPFSSLKYGVIINLVIEPILQSVTFFIVGFFYERGSNPALGSILYLFFYAVHTSLILLCSKFYFANYAILSIVVLYSLILGFLIIIKNKLA